MSFDVIITTYNRPKEILSLVYQIKQCHLHASNIIVVDSTDVDNDELRKTPGVVYVKSSHKNQPYQRYLGFLLSKSEFVVFFDDDITITNKSIFNILLESFVSPEIVGSNVKFYQEGEITVNRESGVRKIDNSNFLINALMTFTGAPHIKKGKSWLVGLKGVDDETVKTTESFGGPGSMCFKREIVPHLFDAVLFSLFERKMAMGEDKYISMGALRYGKLKYNSIICMTHPANQSLYFDDVFSFTRKEIYSRLWLSLRYADVKGKSRNVAYGHYYWFALWRLLFSLYSLLINFDQKSYFRLKGKFFGIIDTFRYPFKDVAFNEKGFWDKELQRNIIVFNRTKN